MDDYYYVSFKVENISCQVQALNYICQIIFGIILIYIKMRFITFCVLSILFIFPGFSQKITVSGTVKEEGTGENLIGANIYDKVSQKGTVTNQFGFYSYTTTGDSLDLYFSFVGFQAKHIQLKAKKDTLINVTLIPDGTLEEVVVSASDMDQIQEITRMSSVNVPIEQIKELPALMGEVDVFKVLQLLPGVQSGTEGGSGLTLGEEALTKI